MKVLDLFCGAGGAAVGYSRAGFEVVGVDIKNRSTYPFEFIKMDALEAAVKYSKDFDLIHASPPCQGYSNKNYSSDSKYVRHRGKNEPRLIEPIRDLIKHKPYVIENVTGARNSMVNPFILCGSMFDLPIPRHRLFETNWFLEPPFHPKCFGMAKQYALENNIDYRDLRVSGKGRRAGISERWKFYLGIDWQASQAEIVEMLPPVYTEYIGSKYAST